MTLYHYTCDDGHAGIQATGSLRPHSLPGLPQLVWLTDLDVPIRDALGLTSHSLKCDRTRHRFRVTDPTGCEPYLTHHTRQQLRALELAEGARPKHWWVSEQPVTVVYDPLESR